MILLRPTIDARRANLEKLVGSTDVSEDDDVTTQVDVSRCEADQLHGFASKTNDSESFLQWFSRRSLPRTEENRFFFRLGDRRDVPLRVRIAVLTAIVVGLIVVIMSAVAYVTVSRSLVMSIDRGLEDQASTLLTRIENDPTEQGVQNTVVFFKDNNPTVRISLTPPGSIHYFGDDLSGVVDSAAKQSSPLSIKTLGNERVISRVGKNESSVVLAKGMTDTYRTLLLLALVLLGVALTGVLLAIFAGYFVSKVALGPIRDLQEATEYITETDDLRPIEIHGKDELANLTHSFNIMLDALSESRRKQAEFVADAGHELKTPLTSMRTNIEMLLMMQNSAVSGKFTKEDMAEMEHDIMEQMDELTELVQDLVDLSRGEAKPASQDDVDLEEVIFDSMERVKNRRQDVTFRLETFSWVLPGDGFAISRAVVNLLDNAAKWSPPNGVVRVKMIRVSEHEVDVTFSDSGPGIPPEDRSRVFQRFYRSVEARKMPGSGLGLSIVHQTVEKHGGTITAEESDDGGAMMRVRLPGKMVYREKDRPIAPDEGVDVSHYVQQRGSNSKRVGEEFVQKWRNNH